MGFGIPVRNGIGIGISNYASLKASSKAAWTPAQISTALWLDAADTSTITLNGSTVSQWSDKSGNGRDATQATASNQPTYTSNGLNGKPVLTFDGVNDFLEFPAITVTDNTTYVYSVITRATSGIHSIDVGTSVAGLTRGYANWWFQSDNRLYSILRSSNPSTFGQHGESTATGNFINGLVRSDAGTQAYRNGAVFGTLQQTSGSFLSGPQLDRIGSIPVAGSFAYNNGTIGEIIVGRTALSTEDRQKLEGYLAWKWGLQANLPIDHPYYSAPPLV